MPVRPDYGGMPLLGSHNDHRFGLAARQFKWLLARYLFGGAHPQQGVVAMPCMRSGDVCGVDVGILWQCEIVATGLSI